MPYNNSPASIVRVDAFLQDLLSTTEKIAWASPHPDRLAYYIHQGLAVARRLNHPKYKDLSNKFYIKVSEGKVTATNKQIIGSRIEEVITNEDAKNFYDVIGAILSEPDKAIYFMNVSLDKHDKNKLKNWCDSKNLQPTYDELGLLTVKPNGKSKA